ncbi:hypothetical protein TNIN_196011 [Trichonephila inaurata madagascariensis]|uniref:Uncharacterized protein n=1 Tax=Trichonephila inaurata madagascariensis TaxID=2747483 RepID=A0A8X6YAZ5_9ARAC|nr:hypothetical protein TNIN_196011 [Trichonephila inaurata madagascariensis]
MNCLVITCFLFLIVGAHSMPWFYPWWFAPYYSNFNNEYGSSLGGAPIGLYNRRRDSGPYGESSEVSGVSVNNAKVGIYGRERKRPFYSDWPLL